MDGVNCPGTAALEKNYCCDKFSAVFIGQAGFSGSMKTIVTETGAG
jgi:hypothetical protein